MDFKKDSRWEIFVGVNDFESFLKNGIPEIYLKPAVHEDVKNSFRVIEKLLQHSFYEYEFFDVAATKALMTFELALKIRYKELTAEEWTRKSKKGEIKRDLNNLLTWFLNRSYFETINPYFLKHVKDIRNLLAHPERFSFGGPTMRQWVQHPMNLINDLYEDVELRKQRLDTFDRGVFKLQRFLFDGCKIYIQDKEEIIFHAHIIFIDNKEQPELTYFVFFPIDIDYGDGSIRKHIIEVATTKFEYNQEGSELVIADLYTNSEVKISSLISEDEKNSVAEFKRIQHTQPGIVALISGMISDGDSFYNEIYRQFHKK